MLFSQWASLTHCLPMRLQESMKSIRRLRSPTPQHFFKEAVTILQFIRRLVALPDVHVLWDHQIKEGCLCFSLFFSHDSRKFHTTLRCRDMTSSISPRLLFAALKFCNTLQASPPSSCSSGSSMMWEVNQPENELTGSVSRRSATWVGWIRAGVDVSRRENWILGGNR